jgi:pimeloyl-ACP methyl ester carboxylesterase
MTNPPPFAELFVQRPGGRVYARDYAGDGPAFVLMHGFPDNLHIYDDLIPHLVAAGRRVVAFDFLGFGASDKIPGTAYSFRQQLGDLEAVVDKLGLETIIPVAHDSSGMACLNYALEHRERVACAVMLNSAYAEGPEVLWPEMITLFATASLHDLALAVASRPEQFGWLLTWQQSKFQDALSAGHRRRFETVLGPLIRDNFVAQPSSGPAFIQMAAQFFDEHARNNARLPELKALDTPVKLIWGNDDPYFPVSIAERRRFQLKNASLVVIPAGHWLQVDEPEQVARAMLS